MQVLNVYPAETIVIPNIQHGSDCIETERVAQNINPGRSEYEILGDFNWGRLDISYGFTPSVPPELRNLFIQGFQGVTDNTVLTLSENTISPDIVVRVGDTQGFLGQAYFPGPFPISGDILISPSLIQLPLGNQALVIEHEIGHALGLKHHEKSESGRPDSVLNVDFTGIPYEQIPKTLTTFDYWAIDTMYYPIFIGADPSANLFN